MGLRSLAKSNQLRVEVVFALANRQLVIEVELNAPCTIREAVALSGILDQAPEIDPEANPVGIFGQRRPWNWQIEDQDRIEIYRPLRMSPVEARRLRAKQRREAVPSVADKT